MGEPSRERRAQAVTLAPTLKPVSFPVLSHHGDSCLAWAVHAARTGTRASSAPSDETLKETRDQSLQILTSVIKLSRYPSID